LEAGQARQAEPALRKALTLREDSVAKHPTCVEYRANLAQSYHDLANWCLAANRVGDAEPFHQKALEIRKDLVRDHPDIPDYRANVARSHCGLGQLYVHTGKAQQGERAYQDALALVKGLVRDYPEFSAFTPFQKDVAETYHQLGRMYIDTRRPEEAEQIHREGLGLLTGLLESHYANQEPGPLFRLAHALMLVRV